MSLVLSNKGKGMQISSEQPLGGEERYVTTRITAAKETILRAAVPKFRLEVCKMKKSKLPKLSQNLGLDELFLEKIL